MGVFEDYKEKEAELVQLLADGRITLKQIEDAFYADLAEEIFDQVLEGL